MKKTSSAIIQTHDLTKRYMNFTAVNKLNLSIEKGEIFGLLGPNGAGKTTLILMLLGLTEPTFGNIRACGFDPFREPLKVKRRVGYLSEKVGLYENITAKQNLKYLAQLNRIPDRVAIKRIDEALSTVGLNQVADKKVRTFSRGMKQRLGIANVIIKKPMVALLDEPTQGIDPQGVVEILELFNYLNQEEGVTIMLSSHLIHQVQQICDRVGIMVSGNMVIRGTIEDLVRAEDQKWVLEIEAPDLTKQLMDNISEIKGFRSIEKNGDILIITSDGDIRSEISATIIKGKGSIIGMRVKSRSLQEIYQKFSEGT